MKYFIFDMGAVLVKPMKVKKIYKSFSWSITWEDFSNKFTFGQEAESIHKGMITAEEYFNYLKQFLIEDVSYEEFLKVYESSKQYPYRSSLEVIKKVKEMGYKVYILSNLREIDFYYYQKKMDVNIFDDFFLSYELHLLKPDKEIYQYVLDKLKAQAKDVYFFDDRIENVNGAKQLGINSYQVTGKTIKSIFKKEILPIIEKK